MITLINLVRTFIGGKTELGIIVSVVALIIYLLPIVPAFGVDALLSLLKVVGILTGVALLSRIEDKKGFLKALKSLFGPWKK
ncbi:hypothetical protein LCGC14_1183580 [marine sediment metagenome]|uniref:Uncharacterized protein n=1 Tax=marine sediment metagenome TaxID=412755 RepID=A0A0F9M981_9ZZZZ